MAKEQKVNSLTVTELKELISEALNSCFSERKSSDSEIIGIDEALESRELIKVKILESCQQDKNEIAQELSLKTDAEVVQILGRTIILYRESEKEIYRLP